MILMAKETETQNPKPKSLNQLKRELRQMKAPVIIKSVVKNHNDKVEKVNLYICYHDREETYELVSKSTYKEVDREYEQPEGTYNQYDAIELCKGGGGRQIHYQTKVD